MPDLAPILEEIQARRAALSSDHSLVVAVSGIDASGKGYTTKRIVEALQNAGVNAVGVNLDSWMNLPPVRFGNDRPGEHFYRHGFRFDELFDQLILPLKRTRSVAIDARNVVELSTEYFQRRYEYQDVDVVVLEGVFLLQAAFRDHFDLAVWVECSFETAIERAILRGQEGLPPDETVEAFERIYFPAQHHHFGLDNPKVSADLIFVNDPRIALTS